MIASARRSITQHARLYTPPGFITKGLLHAQWQGDRTLRQQAIMVATHVDIPGRQHFLAHDFDQQWRKRRRVIDTLLLILFIFRLVLSKNQQGYATTINELWDQCRRMNVPLPQAQPVAASAMARFPSISSFAIPASYAAPARVIFGSR